MKNKGKDSPKKIKNKPKEVESLPKEKNFDWWFDVIVTVTFISIAFFGLIMWLKFDKMESKINEQRLVIAKLLKDKVEVETENEKLKLEIDKRQQLLDSLMVIDKNN